MITDLEIVIIDFTKGHVCRTVLIENTKTHPIAPQKEKQYNLITWNYPSPKKN